MISSHANLSSFLDANLRRSSVEGNRAGDSGGIGELVDGDWQLRRSRYASARGLFDRSYCGATNLGGNPHVQEFALAANSV
jgi:hypothetical protein